MSPNKQEHEQEQLILNKEMQPGPGTTTRGRTHHASPPVPDALTAGSATHRRANALPVQFWPTSRWPAGMALRAAGLLRALEKGLGRPKGHSPNEMFAQYVQGLEQRAAAAAPAEAAALASTVEDWQYCVESVERYKVRPHLGRVVLPGCR